MQAFEGFTVDDALMAAAAPEARVHALPARVPGLEVTADVIDGPRSRVFRQGHNRLHAARGALAFLVGCDAVSVKQRRQQAIVRLIGQHPVGNQPQLLELLAQEGVRTTQATVSRDLDELGVIKVRAAGGQTVYALPGDRDRSHRPVGAAPPGARRVGGRGRRVRQHRRRAHAAGLRSRRRLGARPQRASPACSARSPATTR